MVHGLETIQAINKDADKPKGLEAVLAKLMEMQLGADHIIALVPNRDSKGECWDVMDLADDLNSENWDEHVLSRASTPAMAVKIAATRMGC